MKAFADRDQAGFLLGHALAALAGLDEAPGRGALVLGIPRGGVIVAAAVARVIGADLDVLVPAKIRAPHQPELAIGAVAPDGGVWLDTAAVAALAIPDAVLDAQVSAARQEVLRRTAAFRGDRTPPSIAGRFVVLVDDGIATGATITAAARSLRAQDPARLVVAVPVAPGQAVLQLAAEVDRVVCLASPEPFMAVGQWYQDFRQVGDDAVRQALPGTGRQT
jgi:putative phosphoribosyl transferase